MNIKNKNFSDLIDPNKYQDTFNLDDFSKDTCENLFRKLTLIREAEIKIALRKKIWGNRRTCALSTGQEAIPVGISAHLSKNDYIFGAHRSHAHLLSLGSSLRGLFAEILGKSTGVSRGFGGSMHLYDSSVGFMGSTPIVAGTIPLAVGAGFAIARKESNSISVAYLGDGAVEEGVFHESLNLAKVNDLPIVFVIENNLFSSHMDIKDRQPSFFTSRFAEANLISHRIVDGNNIKETMEISGEIIKKVRDLKQPALIEAITYRWYGHVDWREDIDVGKNRCKNKLEQWKQRCPIKRFKDSLIEQNIFSEAKLNDINLEIMNTVKTTWDIALNDPWPEERSLLSNVYFQKND